MPVAELFTKWRRLAKQAGLVEGTVRPAKIIRYQAAANEPGYIVAFAKKNLRLSRIGFEAMRKPPDVEK